MRSKLNPATEVAWRKLGWLTVLAFSLNGLITTSVMVWGMLSVMQ